MGLRPNEWHELFKAPVSTAACGRLLIEVREYLEKLPADEVPLSTTDLTEALWPVRFAMGTAHTARVAMVDALMQLAKTTLSDCARKAAKPRTRFGKEFFPWLWYPPAHQTTPHTCPQCGHKFLGG